MAEQGINIELVYIALDKVEPFKFEDFFHAFYPSIAGEKFIPLGGIGDGGADALYGTNVSEGERTKYFYQASKAKDHRAKIRNTVKRLREFGRDPKTLVYVTSRRVQHIDVEESNLTQELDVVIKIRDAAFVATHINKDLTTREAFRTYLQPAVEFLRKIGNPGMIAPSKHIASPAVYVFLRQELERLQGKESLINALADGLILWALEGTDPDQDILLSEKQVVEKIETAIPSTQKILHGIIPTRLRALAKAPKPSRPVRWHRKQNLFCLSYKVRQRVEKENIEDETLRLDTLNTFENRIVDFYPDTFNPSEVQLAAKISLEAIEKTFEDMGLEFSAFLAGEQESDSFKVVLDHVETCLTENNVEAGRFSDFMNAIEKNLYHAFHASTPEERVLFSKLSTTYTLLFSLNTEPRLLEYFQNMASDFYLYVGSDILIMALSERYLREEDQKTQNALKIIQVAGGKLVLTEPVLEEVYAHIKSTDFEFIYHYKDIEASVDEILARNIDRILIRSYFYAKLEPPVGVSSPKGWSSFINQFCDPDRLHRPEGYQQVKYYLMNQFNMEFESTEDITGLCDLEAVGHLTEQLIQDKSDERLAKNDALMALAVYGRRKRKREYSTVSEFGLRTWWLTGETKILKYTKELVNQNRSRYMMRPEFILNFIALSPSAAEIRETYKSIFPNLLGIQLARRVDEKELKEVLDKVKEAQELEPARRSAVITQLSDQLKSDFRKRYEQNLG